MPERNIRLDKDGFRIVRFFMQHPEREMTADEISKTLNIDEVDAGIILNSLEKAGFLKGKGKGLSYHYSVSKDVIATKITKQPSDDDSTRYIG